MVTDVIFIPGEGPRSQAPEATIRQELERITGERGEIVGGRSRIRRLRARQEAEARQAEAERRAMAFLAQQEAERKAAELEAQKQAEAEAERLALEQQAARIRAEREARKTQDAEIQPFRREQFAFPFPSRRELGASGGFLGDVATFAGRETRFALGTETPEDVLGIGGEVPIAFGLEEQVRIRQIPTGTIIDPASGIRTDLTAKEFREQEFFLGGLGVPEEFEIQDIGREVISTRRRALQETATGLQQKINVGELTLEQAETRLETARQEEQARAEVQFQVRAEEFQRQRARRQATFESVSGFEDFDVGPLLRSGAAVGGIALGGAVGGPLIATGVAATESAALAGSIFQRPEQERLGIALESALIGGIGAPGFARAEKEFIQLAAERKALQGLASEFRRGELRETIIRGKDFDVAFIKGGRERFGGTFVEEFEGVGGILRGPRGTFEVGGKLKVTTKLDVSEAAFIGRKPPSPIIITEEVPLQAKGFSAPSDIGRLTFVQPKEGPIVSGITRPVSERTFETQFGELRRFGIATQRPVARRDGIQIQEILERPEISVEIAKRDIGITRVLGRDRLRSISTFDISGTELELKGRLQQPSTIPIVRQAIEKSFRQQIKPVSQGIPRSTLAVPTIKTDLRSSTSLIQRDIQKELTSLSQISKPSLTGALITPQGVRARTTPVVISGTMSGLKQPQLLGEVQAVKLDTRLLGSFRQTAQDPFKGIPRTPTTPTIPSEFRGFRFGFPPIIPLPSGIPKFPRERKTAGPRDFFRTPSFAAVEFGFEAFEPSPLEFTGIVERPIIRKKKRRR